MFELKMMRLSKLFWLPIGLLASLVNAQPICTPNMSPEQAFLAIKNASHPNATSITTVVSQPNTSRQPPLPTPSRININTATEAELIRLNGINSKKAQDIILYREMIAPFRTVDDLDNVKGIGKATVDKNRALITVGDGQTVAR